MTQTKTQTPNKKGDKRHPQSQLRAACTRQAGKLTPEDTEQLPGRHRACERLHERRPPCASLGRPGERGISSGVLWGHLTGGEEPVPIRGALRCLQILGFHGCVFRAHVTRMGLDSEVDAGDLMPSVTTTTHGEGVGVGRPGRNQREKPGAFAAASPQALGRAVPGPSQGSGLSDKRPSFHGSRLQLGLSVATSNL